MRDIRIKTEFAAGNRISYGRVLGLGWLHELPVPYEDGV
jgi:hypothetical protein